MFIKLMVNKTNIAPTLKIQIRQGQSSNRDENTQLMFTDAPLCTKRCSMNPPMRPV